MYFDSYFPSIPLYIDYYSEDENYSVRLMLISDVIMGRDQKPLNVFVYYDLTILELLLFFCVTVVFLMNYLEMTAAVSHHDQKS